MKKLLFFTLIELKSADGITKKILYQKNALEELGYNVYLMNVIPNDNTSNSICIDNEVIKTYNVKFKWSINLNIFKDVFEFVVKNKIEYIYVRYTHFASPSINKLFSELKKRGIKIILEIPTYPYDNEFKGFKPKIYLYYDKIWRHFLAKNLAYIVTFDQSDSIWGCPTIKIKNGIDFNHIKLKEKTKPINDRVELIAVATIAFWHGFDRIIEGIKIYNNSEGKKNDVHLNIVGGGDIKNLVSLADKYNLKDYVTFHGPKYGKELDDLFEISDLAIGSLGRHRSGITNLCSLKNVEYAARGIPFIYSEVNVDFDKAVFVKKIAPDETPVNIQELIEWRKKFNMEPGKIRNSIISSLSWKKQMELVCSHFD
ncbi:glycosyltransferase [uncultured Bacteroides sp.]|uniref:glycosyltransferase n=1 Tax=uncultured Bacteroides sp. TaxID=162156 RepID=UPI002592A03E|nr:glycosyltransferase [uncultured Bacteroides sp.]